MESAYKACLARELRLCGLNVEIEKPMPLIYKDVKLDVGYRIDMVVEKRTVVETKTVDAFTPIDISQTLSYLRLGGYKIGLLLNFRVVSMKDGIKRVVL